MQNRLCLYLNVVCIYVFFLISFSLLILDIPSMLFMGDCPHSAAIIVQSVMYLLG